MFQWKKNNIYVKPINFIARLHMWSAPEFIFRSSERIYIFFRPMGPQRFDLMPRWTKIPIQLVSVISVDWGTYDTTMNKLWTLVQQNLSTGDPFGPF